MRYKKIFIQRLKEEGGLKELPSNSLDIILLPKTEELSTKVSLEVRKPEIKGEEGEVRSFRTSSKFAVEDIISALSQALGYMDTENGLFNDLSGKIDKKELEARINDRLRYLFNKVRVQYTEGVRKFAEK